MFSLLLLVPWLLFRLWQTPFLEIWTAVQVADVEGALLAVASVPASTDVSIAFGFPLLVFAKLMHGMQRTDLF
jgi:hypothetical protein